MGRSIKISNKIHTAVIFYWVKLPVLFNHLKVRKATKMWPSWSQAPLGQGVYLLCLFPYFQPSRGRLTVGTQKIFVAWMNTKCGFCFGEMSLVIEYARLNISSGVRWPTPTYAGIHVKHFHGKDFFFPIQRLRSAINHIKMVPEIEKKWVFTCQLSWEFQFWKKL